MFDKVDRLKNHKSKEHNVKCETCGKMFVSKFNVKNAENFSTKALALKLCYLQFDEVHWLMRGKSF